MRQIDDVAKAFRKAWWLLLRRCRRHGHRSACRGNAHESAAGYFTPNSVDDYWRTHGFPSRVRLSALFCSLSAVLTLTPMTLRRCSGLSRASSRDEGTADGHVCVLSGRASYGVYTTAYLRHPGT